jgi:hypothetical protein
MKFTKEAHPYIENIQTPNHIWREFTKKNSEGETLTIEFTRFNYDHSKTPLFKDWYKRELTKCVLQSPWYVQTYIYDTEGNCRGKYNITLKTMEDNHYMISDGCWKELQKT